MEAPLPIILGGPSGSGKSSLGHFLQARGWLHLESDRHVPGGFAVLGLHDVWKGFYDRLDPVPLAVRLEQQRADRSLKRAVLSIASDPLSVRHLQSAKGVLLIQFLAGPGKVCHRNFYTRENLSESQTFRFWHENNDAIIAALETPAYAGHRLEAIRQDGSRVAPEVLEARLLELSCGNEG